MSELAPRISLYGLTFTGTDQRPVCVSFREDLNVLFGASNTGKTFTVKSIDFMLGAKGPLPDISDRIGYERAWIGLNLPTAGEVTLMRALAGGAFELFPGYTTTPNPGAKANRKLSARNDATNTENVSQFLLGELKLTGREIAFDVNGKKRPLSFRDLVRFCLVDEVAIQSESSPIESGQVISTTAERSVFKLLLTGQDDSAVIPVLDRKSFKTSTIAKQEVLDDLLNDINNELAADFPDADGLAEQSSNLEASWERAQQEANLAQQSIREKLTRKSRLASLIFERGQRRAEIQINFGRFEQLGDVYKSDVSRLEAIEEAGFVLSLAGDKPCPLCGASPEDQHNSHGIADIRKATDAANVEIEKIRKQQGELDLTVAQLGTEGLQIERSLEELEGELATLEAELSELAPAAQASRQRLDEVLSVRDHVRRGLELLEQRASLIKRKDELAALKPTSKADRPQLGIPGQVLHDFAQTVSGVLREWQFPGNRHVSFDDVIYDLKIDGKNRRDNGKGVRAVTHSAFKVALLMFCRERKLPHPGFIVLDTPLLTYRDPIKSDSPLEADEAALKNTSLKEFFFAHLSSISGLGQIIIVENVDLPTNIESLGNVEIFTGDPSNGRFGLFPHKSAVLGPASGRLRT
ncbi:MAG: hypothetical protein WB764_24165 [Xanthobacteraceae bacterium]